MLRLHLARSSAHHLSEEVVGVCKYCCEFHECLIAGFFFNLKVFAFSLFVLLLFFRIVLISGRRSFCSIFSVLPYRDSAHVGYVYACLLCGSLGERL